MRSLAILISVLVSVSASATSAETLQESAVTLFKDVCVVPATPEAMMATAEKVAAARDWKLDQTRSGRQPLRLGELPPGTSEQAPDPNELRILIVKIWDGSLPPMAEQVKMFVSIVGPEKPELRYSLCSFVVPGRVSSQIATEISRLLPSTIKSQVSSYNWYLPGERKNLRDCGKMIAVNGFDNDSTMLSFVDVKFPGDDQRQTFPCK